MSILLGTLALPDDLRWSDEFAWSPVVRSQQYGLTGALILQEAVRKKGRPITLEAKKEALGYIWVARSTIAALYALVSTPQWSSTLTLEDGRAFTVAFREAGLIAEPIQHIAPHQDADPYTFTLKLQTV